MNYKIRSKICNSKILDIHGMSTAEVRIFLNELVKNDTNYLEIGLYTGSTFLSAMYENEPNKSFAIDSFNDFEDKDGKKIMDEFLHNCSAISIRNFCFIKSDSFSLTEEQKQNIKDINLYFYDAGHSYRDHFYALKYYLDALSKIFIFIVDDWTHPEAQYGTMFAIQKLNIKVHKQWILGKSQHDKNPGLNWHNGLYVAVLEKP